MLIVYTHTHTLCCLNIDHMHSVFEYTSVNYTLNIFSWIYVDHTLCAAIYAGWLLGSYIMSSFSISSSVSSGESLAVAVGRGGGGGEGRR